MTFRMLLLALVLGLGAQNCPADFQGATHVMPFDEGTDAYGKATDSNVVTALQRALDQGQTKLQRDKDFGYLLSVLEKLKVPKSSQMLVFSKTSFQRDRISPRTPRSLFFNDDVYVGFIPGAPLLEVSVADPKMGAVFYTLDQSADKSVKFARTDQCLECHAASRTMGVPGHLLRSFVTEDDGAVDLSTGINEVNHRTPMKDRWGGWYVTGTHGAQTHQGNLIGAAAFERQKKEPNFLGNITNLSRFFATSRYPGGQSDIVALMVLEHQTHMHNFITRLNFEAETTLRQYGHVRYLDYIIDPFLKYLLFTEEAPITSEIKGASHFSQDFTALGPRDKRGRSLRDFDLQTRLFKYPCSYLIYSADFDCLPKPARDRVYERLWEILTGKDTGPDFARLTADSRRAILEILAETKTGLPDYWRRAGK